MKAACALVIACGLVLSACGDSPGGPSAGTLDLAGTWAGTWTFVSGGATVTDAVTMTVTQSGTSASGQWSATGGAGGVMAFSRTADFTGTATVNQTLLSGVNCSASTTTTGTASSTQIRITLAPLTPSGLCQWATNQQFTFTR